MTEISTIDTEINTTINPAKKILTSKEAEVWSTSAQIIEAAHREAEKIKIQALKEAEIQHQEGFKNGMEEARINQVEEVLKIVENGIKYIEHVENSLVEIVTIALEKIIGNLSQKQAVAAVVKEALGHMIGEEKIQVRIHPDCVDHLKKFSTELSPNLGLLEIVPDNRLDKNDCILENKLGSINASIPLQLKNLQIAMQNALGQRTSA